MAAYHEPGADQPTRNPSQEESSSAWSIPLLGAVRGGFRVPMHGLKFVTCFALPAKLRVTISEFLGSNEWCPFE